MIVRAEGDGWRLITQPAHAWLAGELAAAWGREGFARPEPREPLILATRLHDIGWLDWDAAPRLDGRGRPVDFLQTDLEEAIPIWRRAVARLTLIDPYAALLVSRHATTIFRRRQERAADPPEARQQLETLHSEHAAIQARLQAELRDHPDYGRHASEERVAAVYRWLRACDLLSLHLCSDAFPPTGNVPEVPGAAGDFVSLAYEVTAPFSLALSPFPFGQAPLRLSLQTRRLPARRYADQAALIAALDAAPWEPQAITIQAA